MFSQISQLGIKYTEWVNKPVDRPLRLFESNVLELFTKTHWWLVPLFWIPVISFYLYCGNKEGDDLKISVSIFFIVCI